ncbi:MAG: FAD-binding oxidoreductase [Bacteroidetes bacterium]|nr:FAD-binding oxidoreductase [Bacteroidota bacterium]
MSVETKDIIIVGQGIAGSVLALELIKRGKNIIVIDNASLSTSSRVAAGIWNPVVFKRLTKSWMIDELTPCLNEFYSSAEKILGVKFLEERKIAKLFTEEQEINLWKKKVTEDMHDYLSEDILEMHEPTSSKYAIVKQAGNLDTSVFLTATSQCLKVKESYLDETFNHDELKINASGVSYKNILAAEIIFCEGHLVKNNPHFNYIPFKPAKGDVLTISCKQLDIDFILNKGMFIMPLGNHLFKCGATYNWQDLTDVPNPAGKEELVAKLKKLISYEFEVIKHEAGVRPSVIDRRPVIGAHPTHSQLKIFNGLGTKAVMLAPFFAKQLCDYLMEGKELNGEVDVKRFERIY